MEEAWADGRGLYEEIRRELQSDTRRENLPAGRTRFLASAHCSPIRRAGMLVVDHQPILRGFDVVDSDKDWETWGKTDPYYGVVSHDQFHKGTIEENKLEFFETGQLRIADSLQRLERHFGPINRRRALDFGCGVGRLTIPLARAFDEVVGLDISPSMLAEAQTNAQNSSVHNIVFASSDDGLSNAPGDFDLVYSYIVLQHIPITRGMQIFENLLDKVRPGGGFALHMSIATGRFRDALRKAVRYTTIGNYAANLLKGRPINEPVMQMNEYSPFEIMAQLRKRGIEEVVAQPEWHRTALTASWLGRVPST